MEIQVIGKNITVTEGIKNAAISKLTKMTKYFHDGEDVHARVVVRSYPIGAKVEVTIFTPLYDFRAEVKDNDLYAAIDLSIDKLDGQIRKLKTRMDRRKDKVGFGKAVYIENIESEARSENADEIVRTKSIYLEPMTLDEAINRMEALGHSFFIYLDSEDNKVSVVYDRLDGGFGVIEVENEIK